MGIHVSDITQLLKACADPLTLAECYIYITKKTSLAISCLAFLIVLKLC